MSSELNSPKSCPMCGALLSAEGARCPQCGEETAPSIAVEPRPLWQKILIAVAILIGVQWALVVLLFAVCLFA